MIAFIVWATAVTVAVIAWITWGVARGSARAPDPTRDRACLNARLLGEAYATLDAARATLGEHDWRSEHDALTQRVLHEARPAPAAARGAPWAVVLLVVLLLPLGGAALYARFGTPSIFAPTPVASPAAGGSVDRQALQSDVAALRARLARTPDDPPDWAALGEGETMLRHFHRAVAAFDHIGASLAQNPTWLAEQAEALTLAAGGNPLGRPERVARRALALAPDNMLALMVTGFADVRRGDATAARPLLRRALAEVDPASQQAAFLRALLAQAAERSTR